MTLYVTVESAHHDTVRVFVSAYTFDTDVADDVLARTFNAYRTLQDVVLKPLSIWGGSDADRMISVIDELGQVQKDILVDGYEIHSVHTDAILRILRNTHRQIAYSVTKGCYVQI